MEKQQIHTIRIDDTGTVYVDIDEQWIRLDTLVDQWIAHVDTLSDTDIYRTKVK